MDTLKPAPTGSELEAWYYCDGRSIIGGASVLYFRIEDHYGISVVNMDVMMNMNSFIFKTWVISIASK